MRIDELLAAECAAGLQRPHLCIPWRQVASAIAQVITSYLLVPSLPQHSLMNLMTDFSSGAYGYYLWALAVGILLLHPLYQVNFFSRRGPVRHPTL